LIVRGIVLTDSRRLARARLVGASRSRAWPEAYAVGVASCGHAGPSPGGGIGRRPRPLPRTVALEADRAWVSGAARAGPGPAEVRAQAAGARPGRRVAAHRLARPASGQRAGEHPLPAVRPARTDRRAAGEVPGTGATRRGRFRSGSRRRPWDGRGRPRRLGRRPARIAQRATATPSRSARARRGFAWPRAGTSRPPGPPPARFRRGNATPGREPRRPPRPRRAHPRSRPSSPPRRAGSAGAPSARW
jgi:hypothetical protein